MTIAVCGNCDLHTRRVSSLNAECRHVKDVLKCFALSLLLLHRKSLLKLGCLSAKSSWIGILVCKDNKFALL